MDGWTTATQVAAAAALLAVLVALALVVVVLRLRAAARRQAAEDRAVREDLVRRLEALERPAPVPTNEAAGVEVAEFVITDMGREPVPEQEAPTRMEGRLFADVVLRETVVKAASWTHGVRTALSAENRNRIRFEMKRESKRSTKQRKADVKEALRQYYARQDTTSQEDLA